MIAIARNIPDRPGFGDPLGTDPWHGLPVTAAYIVLATPVAPALFWDLTDQFVIAIVGRRNLSGNPRAILCSGCRTSNLLSRP